MHRTSPVPFLYTVHKAHKALQASNLRFCGIFMLVCPQNHDVLRIQIYGQACCPWFGELLKNKTFTDLSCKNRTLAAQSSSIVSAPHLSSSSYRQENPGTNRRTPHATMTPARETFREPGGSFQLLPLQLC